MKQHNKHRQKQGGFTLVELIVVIAIIGILAALVVPSVSGYVQRAQATTCQHNIQNVAQMLDQVVAQDMGSYSDEAKLNDLLKNIMENNGDYFNKPVRCPSGGDYTYSASWAKNGSLQCTITCSKHEGIEGSKSVAQKVEKSSGTHMEELMDLYNQKLKKGDPGYDRLIELLGGVTTPNNTKIREAMLKENGGEWPELEKEIASETAVSKDGTLYVQPYVTTKNNKTDTLIYASTSPNNSGQPWYAYAVYNPNDKKWYKPVGKKTENVANLYSTENGIDQLITSLSDETKWTPID